MNEKLTKREKMLIRALQKMANEIAESYSKEAFGTRTWAYEVCLADLQKKYPELNWYYSEKTKQLLIQISDK